MASPYSDLAAKLELASTTFLKTKSLSTENIYEGQDSEDKQAPAVISYAEGPGEEDPPFTGNFWLDLQVIVKYVFSIDADGVDPKPLNDALVAAVFDAMLQIDLPTQLNAQAIPDFTCFTAQPLGQETSVEGSVRTNALKLRVYSCAASLYP